VTLRLLLPLLLVAAAVSAQDVPITPEALELMPGLWPSERRELWKKVGPLFEELHRTGERFEARHHRDPPSPPEREAVEGRVAELVQEIERMLRENGFDDAAIARLERMPRGPLHAERYAHATVFDAPDLTVPQRALVERLVLAVDAAQAALVACRDRLEHHARTAGEDEGPAIAFREQLERQIREIDHRFWRVVGFVLTVPQRAAVRPLYPPRFSEIRGLQGHVYLLEGLTPSQASQVKALFTEYESESAADRAEMERLEKRLRAGGGEERADLEKRLHAAHDRHEALVRELMERGRRVLTEKQNEQLQAVTPLQSPEDRRRHPGEIVAGMDLRPQQRTRLEGLGARIDRAHRTVQEEARRKLGELRGEVGEESPQAMMMEMAERGAQSKVITVMEQAAREALLEVLDAEQIIRWTVSSGAGR
jgi:hypothetical protein